jgi:hypothetical protein
MYPLFDNSFNSVQEAHIQGYLYGLMNQYDYFFPQEDVFHQYYFISISNEDQAGDIKNLLVNFVMEKMETTDDQTRSFCEKNLTVDRINDWDLIENKIKRWFPANTSQGTFKVTNDFRIDSFTRLLKDYLAAFRQTDIFEWNWKGAHVNGDAYPKEFLFKFAMDFTSFIIQTDRTIYLLCFSCCA